MTSVCRERICSYATGEIHIMGAKVTENKSSREQTGQGANWPGSELDRVLLADSLQTYETDVDVDRVYECRPKHLGRSPFLHLSHPNPNHNSYPNPTLTLTLTLTLRRVTKVRKWTRAKHLCPHHVTTLQHTDLQGANWPGSEKVRYPHGRRPLVAHLACERLSKLSYLTTAKH